MAAIPANRWRSNSTQAGFAVSTFRLGGISGWCADLGDESRTGLLLTRSMMPVELQFTGSAIEVRGGIFMDGEAYDVPYLLDGMRLQNRFSGNPCDGILVRAENLANGNHTLRLDALSVTDLVGIYTSQADSRIVQPSTSSPLASTSTSTDAGRSDSDSGFSSSSTLRSTSSPFSTTPVLPPISSTPAPLPSTTVSSSFTSTLSTTPTQQTPAAPLSSHMPPARMAIAIAVPCAIAMGLLIILFLLYWKRRRRTDRTVQHYDVTSSDEQILSKRTDKTHALFADSISSSEGASKITSSAFTSLLGTQQDGLGVGSSAHRTRAEDDALVGAALRHAAQNAGFSVHTLLTSLHRVHPDTSERGPQCYGAEVPPPMYESGQSRNPS